MRLGWDAGVGVDIVTKNAYVLVMTKNTDDMIDLVTLDSQLANAFHSHEGPIRGRDIREAAKMVVKHVNAALIQLRSELEVRRDTLGPRQRDTFERVNHEYLVNSLRKLMKVREIIDGMKVAEAESGSGLSMVILRAVLNAVVEAVSDDIVTK